jgi:hypothetical protein
LRSCPSPFLPLAKMAFTNYYFFVIAALLCAVASARLEGSP